MGYYGMVSPAVSRHEGQHLMCYNRIVVWMTYWVQLGFLACGTDHLLQFTNLVLLRQLLNQDAIHRYII